MHARIWIILLFWLLPPLGVMADDLEPEQPELATLLQNSAGLVKSKVSLKIELPKQLSAGEKKYLLDELNRLLNQFRGQAFQLEMVTELNRNPVSWEDSKEYVNFLGETQIETTVTATSQGWKVQSSRWTAALDSSIQSPLVTVRSLKLLPIFVSQQIVDLIAPVMTVGEMDLLDVQGTLYGGEYGSSDPASALLAQDDLLQVVMLYANREGKLMKRQVLPWTYLKVNSRNRAQVETEIISAFRSPIPKSRRRIDVVAVGVRSLYSETHVQLSRRGKYVEAFPLATVYVTPWFKAESENEPKNTDGASKDSVPTPSVTLVSDRDGHLVMPTESLAEQLGTKLVKIEVMSETVVVARVPYLLGSEENLELTVPDDSARVAAMIRFDQLKTELLKVSAKRAVLITALRKIYDDQRQVDPQPMFDQIALLPDDENFKQQTALIEAAAVKELNELGNRVAASQVRKRAQESVALIDRFLDKEVLTELKTIMKKQSPPPTKEKTTDTSKPSVLPQKRNVVIPKFN